MIAVDVLERHRRSRITVQARNAVRHRRLISITNQRGRNTHLQVIKHIGSCINCHNERSIDERRASVVIDKPLRTRCHGCHTIAAASVLHDHQIHNTRQALVERHLPDNVAGFVTRTSGIVALVAHAELAVANFARELSQNPLRAVVGGTDQDRGCAKPIRRIEAREFIRTDTESKVAIASDVDHIVENTVEGQREGRFDAVAVIVVVAFKDHCHIGRAMGRHRIGGFQHGALGFGHEAGRSCHSSRRYVASGIGRRRSERIAPIGQFFGREAEAARLAFHLGGKPNRLAVGEDLNRRTRLRTQRQSDSSIRSKAVTSQAGVIGHTDKDRGAGDRRVNVKATNCRLIKLDVASQIRNGNRVVDGARSGAEITSRDRPDARCIDGRRQRHIRAQID